jgi:cell division ATPase FtsA
VSYQDAVNRAKEIADQGYLNMFVTISLGGEYINSYDVEADVAQNGQVTTKEMVRAIQAKLNQQGANPKLVEDGLLGRRTLNAILSRLKKNDNQTVSRAK